MLNKLRKTQSAYMASANDIITFQSKLMEKAGLEADETVSASQTQILYISLVGSFLRWPLPGG